MFKGSTLPASQTVDGSQDSVVSVSLEPRGHWKDYI